METEKDGIPTEHNTFIEFDVRAYNSPSRTFLYVRAIRVRFMKFLALIFLDVLNLTFRLLVLKFSCDCVMLFVSQDKQHFNCDVFVNKNASKITFMVMLRY